jgi:Kdo2-lipid IVA lauroyltransferase/acyltransferase
MKNIIEYILIRVLIILLSILPFRILYILSDCCSFVLQNVVRYRNIIVLENFMNAFPDKSIEEIKVLTDRFYKNLCDTILESLKGYSSSSSQLLRRYQFLNPEISNKYFEEGRDVIIALSHYCNWEWGTQVSCLVLKHELISFYKPMSNKYSDGYFLKQRMRQNMQLLSIYDHKYNLRLKSSKPRAYFFINDQRPKNAKKVIRTTFLNQNTACMRGLEEYAKLFNLPVVYADIQKVKRGFYTVQMEDICNNPSETLPGEITEQYMRKLETIIIKKPEDWLWSHRRWKFN